MQREWLPILSEEISERWENICSLQILRSMTHNELYEALNKSALGVSNELNYLADSLVPEQGLESRTRAQILTDVNQEIDLLLQNVSKVKDMICPAPLIWTKKIHSTAATINSYYETDILFDKEIDVWDIMRWIREHGYPELCYTVFKQNGTQGFMVSSYERYKMLAFDDEDDWEEKDGLKMSNKYHNWVFNVDNHYYFADK